MENCAYLRKNPGYAPACLVYFRSVKFHFVKETHDINSLLTLVKIVLASQHKRRPNKSLPSKFVDN